MVGGFAPVAWPANYGVTGIHPFIVNQEGTVYQKDIEPVPGKPFPPVARFDPDRSREPVEQTLRHTAVNPRFSGNPLVNFYRPQKNLIAYRIDPAVIRQ